MRLTWETNALALPPPRRSAKSATARACPKSAMRMQSKTVLCSDVTRSPCTMTDSSSATTCHRTVFEFALRFDRVAQPLVRYRQTERNGSRFVTENPIGMNALCSAHHMKHFLGLRKPAPISGSGIHAPSRPYDLTSLHMPPQNLARPLAGRNRAHPHALRPKEKLGHFDIVGFHRAPPPSASMQLRSIFPENKQPDGLSRAVRKTNTVARNGRFERRFCPFRATASANGLAVPHAR